MKIIFSHGKDSGPYGTKVQHLSIIAKQLGIETLSVDYTFTINPEKRIKKLLSISKNENDKIILSGSSMGAYVSACVAEIIKPIGLFLMAPAFYLPRYKQQNFNLKDIKIFIVHGLLDTITVPENSLVFAKKNLCELHYVNDSHSLSNSTDKIGAIFSIFLKEIINQA